MSRINWVKVTDGNFLYPHGTFTFRKKFINVSYKFQIWQNGELLLSTPTEKKFNRHVNAIFATGEFAVAADTMQQGA